MDTWKCSISSRWNYWIHIFIVIQLHLSQFVHSAPLASYLVSSFTSPDPSLPFNHFTIYNVTGNVYIGARERLYHLNPDLTLNQTENLGECLSSDGKQPPLNDNILLVIAPLPIEKLISCGSCDGYCETRNIADISDMERHDTSDTQTVVSAASVPISGVVTLGSDWSAVGEGIPDSKLYLFTGVSYSSLDTTERRLISKHRLMPDTTTSERFLSFEQRTNAFLQSVIEYYDVIQAINELEFIYYFIQKSNGQQQSTHIGRFCPNSIDQFLDSYTEIELQCGGSGTEAFNVMRAATIGSTGAHLAATQHTFVYAVFTNMDSTDSALCLYDMTDIEQKCRETVDGCIKGTNATGESNEFLVDHDCNLVSIIAGLELIDGHRRPWPSVPLLLAVMPLKILGYLRPKTGALFPLGRDALAVLCVHFCVAVMPFFQRLVLPFFRFEYSNNFLPIGILIFE